MRKMTADIQAYMTRALEVNNHTANQAIQGMSKYLDMMKKARDVDAKAAAKALEDYRNALKNKPWVGIYRNGAKMIKYGKALQAKVLEALPFSPVEPGQNNPAS